MIEYLRYEKSIDELFASKSDAHQTGYTFMVTKEITYCFTDNSTMIYTPENNLVISLPGLDYNLTHNLDVNLM